MTILTGTIIQNYTDRYFGFIKPTGGGQDIFFHYDDLSYLDKTKLSVGDKVQFSSFIAKKGPRAIDIKIINDVKNKTISSNANTNPNSFNDKRNKLSGLKIGIILGVLFAGLVAGFMRFHFNFNSSILYLIVVNCLVFILMGFDKFIASKDAGLYRVPEKVFYILTFIGGTAGILFGMSFFRHKTKKSSFQATLIFIFIIQVIIITLFEDPLEYLFKNI